MHLLKISFLMVLGAPLLALGGVTSVAAPLPLPALTKACFESTCGKTYIFGQDDATAIATGQASYQLVQQELKRPMQLFMGGLIHQAVLMDGIYKNLSKQTKTNFEGPAKAYILMMVYAKNLNQYKDAMNCEALTRTCFFDREKLKSLPQKLSDFEIEAIVSLKDLIAFLSFDLPQLEDFSYLQMLKLLYPGKTLIQAQVTEALAILEMKNQINQRLPGFQSFSQYDLVLARAAAGNKISESEMSYMKAQTTSRLGMEMLFQPKALEAFQKISWDFNKVFQDQFKLYQASKIAQAVQTPKSIKKILQDTVTDGLSYLTYSYSSLPSQKQIDNFKAMLKSVESVAQQMMEEKTKTSLKERFNFEINVPSAKDNIMADWKNFLNQGQAETDKKIQALENIETSLTADLDTTSASALALMMIDTDRDLFGGVSSFTQQATPSFLTDAMLLVDQSIHLSWPTIVHPEVGVAIIAHEMGHVVQKNWPQVIVRENTCLKLKQGTDHYLSEDFADLFSAEVFRRSGGRVQGVTVKNLGCALVARAGDRSQLLLENPNAKDIHSSALYRIMSFAAVQNNPTRECKAFLAAKKEIRFQPYCQWEK